MSLPRSYCIYYARTHARTHTHTHTHSNKITHIFIIRSKKIEIVVIIILSGVSGCLGSTLLGPILINRLHHSWPTEGEKEVTVRKFLHIVSYEMGGGDIPYSPRKGIMKFMLPSVCVGSFLHIMMC